ncbi:hemerythrin domain-containing protein [Antarcticimicrobium luteum]|uniref:Hemerythrin domain-containing protein n=1 Tax=Antarcticimicrobium luteum TaxID=2547397 RepID=A0A4R5VEC2_9RHOB|nr:hemerythrin domain-containing protein [Antarcticimicrobium luteum]TDK50542.1 hemerythrin domain-containing protein [Antarcticimicrobium luteum]
MSDPDLSLHARSGLPEALRVLVEEIPRDAWQAHPDFGGLVAFWLERHLLFRRLLATLEADVQALIDGQIPFEVYAPRLSRLGGLLVNELHGHHQIEDQHYFPLLARFDPRIGAGFDLLDADHQALDGLLNDMATAANAALAGGAPGRLADHLDGFGRMLHRHLEDEEEIVVPVILKTGFGG